MDSIEYVKRHGISRTILDLSIIDKYGYNSLFTDDFTQKLKQIVDAFDLVDGKGGVEISKEILETWAFMLAVKAKVGRLADLLAEDYDALKQAIELVEKCK